MRMAFTWGGGKCLLTWGQVWESKNKGKIKTKNKIYKIKLKQ